RFPLWEGLRSIGVAVGYRREASGRDSLEYRYYISSADLDEQRFASAVRHHWGIENRLHWVLDVTMGEDDCPIYRGNGAEILACLRHIALNMLRSEKTKKASIRRKQNIAGMNSAYLDKVLLAGINGMVKE
ncbi:ISAs1 family transposase, partial [Shewanella chilikensis]|uniref:ISAs1 family transposase n=1 Tax=Shewanella chilikensis TaxID=558541 RepID=UPI0030078A7C